MQRSIVYPSEQPTSNTWLGAEKAKMIALGYLSQGILGTSTIVDGLTCTPTVPATLAVLIGNGSIYQLEPVDSTAYSSLAADTVDQIIKQGINIGSPTSLTLTPPGTSGQAINYLIEAQLLEQDTGSTILPYFNSAQPTIPFSGPAGSGVSQPVFRDCTVSLVAKAGVAATAGSQVTPAPDAGYVGLWAVTVANGATQLTSAQIAQYPGAPFISVKLPQVPTWVQGGTWDWAVDTGTANALAVTLTPFPTSPLTAGMAIYVKKSASPNTGAATIQVNFANGTSTTAPVTHFDGTPLASGDAAGGAVMNLVFDGTSFRYLGAPIATAVGSLTASAGEGISVTGGAVISWNIPGLSSNPNIQLSDLWGYYSVGDTHHRDLTWAQLLAAIHTGLPGCLLNFQFFSSNGTYTPTTNAKNVLVFCQGPGGAGGDASFFSTLPFGGGGGGGSGALCIGYATATTQSVTVGTGGLPVNGANGQSGSGSTSFGTLVVAGPGGGGFLATFNVGGFGGSATAGNVLTMQGNPGEFGDTHNGGNGGAACFGGAGYHGSQQQGGSRSAGPGTLGGGGGGGSPTGDSGGKAGRGGNGWCLVLEFS